MKYSFRILFLIFNLPFLFCNSQSNSNMENLMHRDPVVAGQFYSANPEKLKSDLKTFFKEAKSPLNKSHLHAIVVPHAGYIYSGNVAASAYNQIDPNIQYDRVFIIASSHRTRFNGASIYNKGNYNMPLGQVEVDIDLANKLIEENAVFTYFKFAHNEEHSLEVQLPFLQYQLKHDFKIVPIVIGTNNPNQIESIAKALKPYFNEKNLFVISSDFSHYPEYSDACEVDKITADAIIRNDASGFLETIEKNEKKKIKNLATSICGWTSVLTLLEITQDDKALEYNLVDYQNSGDKSFADTSRVVGYWAISVRKNKEIKNSFILSDEDKINLLKLARNTIEQKVNGDSIPKLKPKDYSEILNAQVGAFVTLTKNKELRGCVGRFQPETPLYQVIQEMAVAAAANDHRFNPVEKDEMEMIDIEISVLTPLNKIEDSSEIELGRHGIYIKQGYNSGTFLPQVAEKTNWSVEEFLGHCAQDKAGIGWSGWKMAEVFTYEAIIFHESEMMF